MSITAREQRAHAKAIEQRAVGNRPFRVGGDREVWAVYSRGAQPACPHCGAVLPPTPDVYLITVGPDGALACDCPTGQANGVCWHKAAVRHQRNHGDFTVQEGPP